MRQDGVNDSIGRMEAGPAMRVFRTVAGMLASLFAAGGTAQAAESGERLVGPPLNGFVVLATERTAEQTGRQEVLRGETAAQWTRMITTVRFNGKGKLMPSNQFLERTLRDLRRTCRGGILSPIATRTMPGYQTSMIHVDCPSALAQEPQSFVRLAIGGGADMYVKEITFRGGRTAMELAWARSYLSGIILCQPRDRQPACQR